jgi:hypothetical protein
MMYVRTFLPWIVYGVVPSGSWQWGALSPTGRWPSSH